MLATSKIICYAATVNPEKSRRFYEQTLGLTLLRDEPFTLVFDGGGAMLRIAKVQALSPAAHTVLGWEVTDLPATIQFLKQRGIVFEHMGGLGQDETGAWQSPSGSQAVWFRDPDGNLLSVTQF